MKRLTILMLLLLSLALLACGSLPTGTMEGSAALPEPSPSPSPTPCPHAVWENGVCTSCGAVCEHTLMSHEDGSCGVCLVCGLPCPHAHWEDGVCADCGFLCAHESHDAASLLCPVCGKRVLHHYEDSVCVRCGEKPALYDDDLPYDLLGKCAHPGKLENLSYKTVNFTKEHPEGEGEPFSKSLWVYTPYNYDPAKKYDVLILLHGMQQTEKGWLASTNYYDKNKEITTTGAQLLDNMYEQGLCEDVIVVSCTYFRDSKNQKSFNRIVDYPQFIGELRYVILPMIAEKYSTYAESPDPADVLAAREHFGVAGLSMGAVVIYSDLLQNAPELFAWYGIFSCADGRTDWMSESIMNCVNNGMPIRCFYNVCGMEDTYYEMQTAYYEDMTWRCPALIDGTNAFYTPIEYWGHFYQVWYTALYNSLQLFFRME